MSTEDQQQPADGSERVAMSDSGAMDEAKAAIEAFRERHQEGEVSGEELYRVMKGVPRAGFPIQNTDRSYRGEYATEQERAAAREMGRVLLNGLADAAVRERFLELAQDVEMRQEYERAREHTGVASRRQAIPRHLAFDRNIEQLPRIVQAIAHLYCGAGVLPQTRVIEIPAAALMADADEEVIADPELRRRLIWTHGVINRPVDVDSVATYAQRADGGLLFIHDFHQVSPEARSEIADALVYEMEFRRETLAVAVAVDEKLLQHFRAVNPAFCARIYYTVI
ncbi:Uncharacterised protein [Mycobacteroides abscessus subsp. abscessus]|uniref:hypothetical protein n=1 Tax=Mycobacteroides abscessus TaxID=36809 RepID=UPI0009A60C75|nr:hypothetical protein [Mycobacteroides abscessus]SLI19703.1 Uncharacterised protein [Mycobacteroides abscessus subsp. abscessus]